jgi:hypothetical protein
MKDSEKSKLIARALQVSSVDLAKVLTLRCATDLGRLLVYNNRKRRNERRVNRQVNRLGIWGGL